MSPANGEFLSLLPVFLHYSWRSVHFPQKRKKAARFLLPPVRGGVTVSGSRRASAARSSLPGCDRFFKSDKNSVKFFFTKVLHKGFFASGKIKIRIDIMIFKGNNSSKGTIPNNKK